MTSLNPKKRILVISGEASGDAHTAKLVSAVLNLNPDVHFFGIGGSKMQQAGVEILVDNRNIAVVGLIEILQHFKAIYQAYQTIKTILRKNPPDLLILVDYPTFNLRMAKIAKKAGVKVLYYISPQLWAWHQSRVKIIRQRVDKMLVIFPFEAEFYRRENVPVEFVGHPLAGHVKTSMSVAQAREHFQITGDKVIGLLPGSRKGEIKRLLPTLLATAQKIKARYPKVQFILPLASSLTVADLQDYLQQFPDLDIKLIQQQTYDALQLCDAAIVTSGTVTLEVALLGVPMVIVYKTAASTYFLAKRVVKIPYIGLCNIVAGEGIVLELIQHRANPEEIFSEVNKILIDGNYRKVMLKNLNSVKEKLSGTGDFSLAAKSVLEV